MARSDLDDEVPTGSGRVVKRSDNEALNEAPPKGYACPECGARMRVLYSRVQKYSHLRQDGMKRRRVCPECGYRLSTREVSAEVLKALREKEDVLEWVLNEFKSVLRKMTNQAEEISGSDTGRVAQSSSQLQKIMRRWLGRK
jgi:transcriptional regulator NrdR family protein